MITQGGFKTLSGNAADAQQISGAPVNGVDEVQTVNSTATGGTFLINFTDPVSGIVRQTAPIAWNAAAATIIAAIHAVQGVPAGVVSGTGGPLPTGVPVTFIGEWSGLNVAPMTIDNTLATGGTVTVAQTTGGVQGSNRGLQKGGLLIDNTTPKVYQNIGTAQKPSYQVVGAQT